MILLNIPSVWSRFVKKKFEELYFQSTAPDRVDRVFKIYRTTALDQKLVKKTFKLVDETLRRRNLFEAGLLWLLISYFLNKGVSTYRFFLWGGYNSINRLLATTSGSTSFLFCTPIGSSPPIKGTSFFYPRFPFGSISYIWKKPLQGISFIVFLYPQKSSTVESHNASIFFLKSWCIFLPSFYVRLADMRHKQHISSFHLPWCDNVHIQIIREIHSMWAYSGICVRCLWTFFTFFLRKRIMRIPIELFYK